jgi:hypothetical protein
MVEQRRERIGAMGSTGFRVVAMHRRLGTVRLD